LYIAAGVYNTFLSGRTGLPLPLVGLLKNERIDNMDKVDMSLDQIKKRIQRDKNYATKVYEDLAYQAAWLAKEQNMDKSFMLQKTSENEAEAILPFEEAYNKALKIFPDENPDVVKKKMTNAFEDMLLPVGFRKVTKEPQGDAKAKAAIDEMNRINKMMNGNPSDATMMRLSFEKELLDAYIIQQLESSEEFREAYESRTRPQ